MSDAVIAGLQAEVAILRQLVVDALPQVRGVYGDFDDELADRMQAALDAIGDVDVPDVTVLSCFEPEDDNRSTEEIIAMRTLALELGVRSGSAACKLLRSSWDTGRGFGDKPS